MKKKLKETIIRRLGGVPAWLFGEFPYIKKHWELKLLECRLSQNLWGSDTLELKYEILKPEDELKKMISGQDAAEPAYEARGPEVFIEPKLTIRAEDLMKAMREENNE